MAAELLAPGDILLVNLPNHVPGGFEPEGKRPVVVVGVPFGAQRFPVLVVVPLTTQTGIWAKQNTLLYPSLPAGSGGLKKESWVLLDQVRSLDVNRIEGYLGSLGEDYKKIKTGLAKLLALTKNS